MMGHWLVPLLLLTLQGPEGAAPAPVIAAPQVVQATAPVCTVRLYPGWAAIYREAKVHVTVGEHEIWLEGLPRDFMVESLRIEVLGPPHTRLLGYQVQTVPSLHLWEFDEIQRRWQAYQDLRSRIATLQLAQDLRQLSLSYWKDAAGSIARHSGEALREGHLAPETLNELVDHILNGMKTTATLPAEIAGTYRRILEEAANRALGSVERLLGKTRRVRVHLRTAQAGEVQVGLRYLQEGNLRWRMQYHLDVARETGRIDFRVEAVVRQTGPEAWTDVALELALGILPRRNLRVPPPPEPWILQPERKQEVARAALEKLAASPMVPAEEVPPEVLVRGERVLAGAARVTIPPDEDFQVTLGTWQLAADLLYRVVPARSRVVVLVARTTNTTPVPWMPGPVRVFVDGHFTGTTNMPLVLNQGAVELPLSVHPEVEVQRKRVRRFVESVGVLSKHKRIHLVYETRLRNNGDEPVALEIMDRNPISEQEAIRITSIRWDPVPDTWDRRTGVAIWKLHVAPDAEQVITLDVTIETPPEMVLEIEKRP